MVTVLIPKLICEYYQICKTLIKINVSQPLILISNDIYDNNCKLRLLHPAMSSLKSVSYFLPPPHGRYLNYSACEGEKDLVGTSVEKEEAAQGHHY